MSYIEIAYTLLGIVSILSTLCTNTSRDDTFMSPFYPSGSEINNVFDVQTGSVFLDLK